MFPKPAGDDRRPPCATRAEWRCSPIQVGSYARGPTVVNGWPHQVLELSMTKEVRGGKEVRRGEGRGYIGKYLVGFSFSSE